MKAPVWTWLPGSSEPTLAGTLKVDAGRGQFQYLDAYREKANAMPIDPIGLRFTRRAAGISITRNHGLPGVIIDAMPAGYGADRLNARHERNLSSFELLEFGPPDGVGAIEVCRDIERKMAWRPSLLSDLMGHITDLEESAPSSRAIRRLLDDGMTSAGGERPKVTIEHDGRLWLAKLQDRGDVPHLPVREFVVMQMAKELNIQVPRILFKRHEGREVFLVERFDRSGDPLRPQRHHFASAHTVLGLDTNTVPGDARRSYLVLADQMRRWIGDETALQADLKELWRRMAYNALVGNGDDHPRNHGLIHDGALWRLSKAFDITPLPKFVRVLAMSVSADGSQDCSAPSLLRACAHFGVDLPEGAAWLMNAARHIADEWQQRLRNNGVPAGHLAQFSPAFGLAHELAEDPSLIYEAVDQIDLQVSKSRRRQLPR